MTRTRNRTITIKSCTLSVAPRRTPEKLSRCWQSYETAWVPSHFTLCKSILRWRRRQWVIFYVLLKLVHTNINYRVHICTRYYHRLCHREKHPPYRIVPTESFLYRKPSLRIVFYLENLPQRTFFYIAIHAPGELFYIEKTFSPETENLPPPRNILYIEFIIPKSGKRYGYQGSSLLTSFAFSHASVIKHLIKYLQDNKTKRIIHL